MLEDKVDLESVVVAPEVQVGRQAEVVAMLERFADDPGLEHGAAQGVRVQVVGAADAQQEHSSPLLGRLDEPLAKVAVVWRQQRHEVAGLQDGEPLSRGGLADAAVRFLVELCAVPQAAEIKMQSTRPSGWVVRR